MKSFEVNFDNSIGLDGHIIASYSLNGGSLGPKDGSFKATWDITNPASSFNIQSEIAVGTFEKFLKASGIIKSANSFDFSVDHNIDIVPIPSFEIAFDNNSDNTFDNTFFKYVLKRTKGRNRSQKPFQP